MTQALLSLDTPCCAPMDRIGFDIGWDHARHGAVPPAECMLDGTPVSQGWRAARAVCGRRTLMASRAVRQWLGLRLQAWREGIDFDLLQVTPNHLQQIESSHCPVTRDLLGGNGDTAPVVARLRDDAGYAAGNLVLLSRLAARAKTGCDVRQALERAERLQREGLNGLHGLTADGWARLATLMSLAVELPHVQAARIPLRALPGNRMRVLNAAQGLQVLLTLRLQASGWSRRARAVADVLPRPELRHDFNLFVGALAARLMSIDNDLDARSLRWAQEDAWADGRVQRRWVQFVVQMSADESQALLQRLADSSLAGVVGTRWLLHASTAAATQGWSLPTGGRLQAQPALASLQRRVQRPTRGSPPQNRSAIMSPSAS